MKKMATSPSYSWKGYVASLQGAIISNEYHRKRLLKGQQIFIMSIIKSGYSGTLIQQYLQL